VNFVPCLSLQALIADAVDIIDHMHDLDLLTAKRVACKGAFTPCLLNVDFCRCEHALAHHGQSSRELYLFEFLQFNCRITDGHRRTDIGSACIMRVHGEPKYKPVKTELL